KGIFQVINFQASAFNSGDNGEFTVNMGVLIKEVYELEEWHRPTTFYLEIWCQKRVRLPGLLYGKDVWWDLNRDRDELGDEIIDGFKSVGFAFFEQFDTRAKFCQNYGLYNVSPRAKLNAAIVLLHTDRSSGESLFREYFTEIKNESHKGYVRTLADKLNIH